MTPSNSHPQTPSIKKQQKRLQESAWRKCVAEATEANRPVAEEEDKERVAVLDLPAGLWLGRVLPKLLFNALTDRATAIVARCHPASSFAPLIPAPPPPPTTGAGSGNGTAAAAAPVVMNRTLRSCWDAEMPLPSHYHQEAGGGGGGGGCGGVVVLGLDLDASKALRIVDRGPAADDTVKATAFRAFWGAKVSGRSE